MGESILAVGVTMSEVIISFLWFAVFLAMIAGCILFVVALARWEMNSWKYVLLALLLVPFVAAPVGWIALFAGGVKRRAARTSTLPPPLPAADRQR